MIIELNGSLLAWYIAIMLTVQVLLFIFTLTAIRFGITFMMHKVASLEKKFGGGGLGGLLGGGAGGGGGGGLLGGLDIGSMLGGLFGGGKK